MSTVVGVYLFWCVHVTCCGCGVVHEHVRIDHFRRLDPKWAGGGPGWVRAGSGAGSGAGSRVLILIGPSQLVATKGSRFTICALLAQSSRMAGASEECQGLGHLNAQLKVVSGEVL